MPLVLSLALGANLVPLLALILIAWPANGETAYTAGNKEITIRSGPHSITTDLAHLAAWMLHRFLHRSTKQTQTVTKLDSLIKYGSWKGLFEEIQSKALLNQNEMRILILL